MELPAVRRSASSSSSITLFQSLGRRPAQRTSNFLLWQSAYAELVFVPTLWPDFDRRHLWWACEQYASRDRRYGGAVPNEVPGSS